MTRPNSAALPDAPTRGALIAQLVESRIAGPIATSRENNLANYRRMVARDPGYLFGLEPRGRWDFDELLALMSARSGVSADPDYVAGPDTIDPELTVDRLEALADVVREVAEARGRVLIATGHPTGLLVVHLEVARLLREVGATLVSRPATWVHQARDGGRQLRHVRHILDVAVAGQAANLVHTHSPQPMQLMLAALSADGEPPPDLVIADHGYAGAAARAGVRTVGYADSNDPALFVGEAEGDLEVTVPLDDNVNPHLYAPMTAYLLSRAFG
jgi:hypothetical protein